MAFDVFRAGFFAGSLNMEAVQVWHLPQRRCRTRRFDFPQRPMGVWVWSDDPGARDNVVLPSLPTTHLNPVPFFHFPCSQPSISFSNGEYLGR